MTVTLEPSVDGEDLEVVASKTLVVLLFLHSSDLFRSLWTLHGFFLVWVSTLKFVFVFSISSVVVCLSMFILLVFCTEQG